MVRFWGRLSVAAGLLAAIFSDLRRRAWWSYRARGADRDWPRTMIVARRPAERRSYVPMVTPMWDAVAARALPVIATTIMRRDEDDPAPVVFVDTPERPDIADLPRVLASAAASGGPPVLATQWLADRTADRVLLVVTYVEPVACTWALSFAVPRRRALLNRIAATGELWVAWDSSVAQNVADDEAERWMPALPPVGLLVPISRPSQIHEILAVWDERTKVD